jgi:hypothetical protein
MFTLRKLFGGSKQPRCTAACRRKSVPLGVEILDDRIMPAGVTYNGGAIIPNVRVEPIFYGSSWSSDTTLKQQAQSITQFWQYLTTSSYMDQLGQYYQLTYPASIFVGHGSALANPDITGAGPTSGTVYDKPGTLGGSGLTIQDLIRGEMLAGHVDMATSNTLYIVYTAPGVGFYASGGINSTNDYGYHGPSTANDGSYGIFPWLPSFNYAVIDYPAAASSSASFATLTWHSTHEFAEAVTDPDLSTGWYQGDSSHEIGDLANGITGNLAGYTVEYLWSNIDNNPALWTPHAHWVRTANGTVTQIVSALNKDGVEELFGIGTDTNHSVYYQIQDGQNGRWDSGAWETLYEGAKQLAVGREENGLLTVWVIGNDNGVHFVNEVSPGNWSGAQWQSLSGWGSAIAVGSDKLLQQQVFVVGGDSHVHYRAETAANSGLSGSSGYSGWGDLGGSFLGENGSKKTLAVNHEADGRLTVFGIWTDSSVRYLDQVSPPFGPNYWSATATWQNLSGGAQDIAVGGMPSGALELFVVGLDNRLHSRWQSGANGSWNGWQNVGGGFISQIAVGQATNGSLEVFGIGADNAVYSIVPTNSPSDGSLLWTDLGSSAVALSLGYNEDGSFTLFEIGNDQDAYTAKI